MRKELPAGEGEGFERSKYDPTRSVTAFETMVGLVVAGRFGNERPDDLDAEVFHEGDRMRDAVRKVFDARDAERAPKVTYQGKLNDHKGRLQFLDGALFTPYQEGQTTLLKGIYRLEVGDHIVVYGEDDAVVWQGRVPLKASSVGVDEEYLEAIGTDPKFFRNLFEGEFRATLKTRDRNVKKDAK